MLKKILRHCFFFLQENFPQSQTMRLPMRILYCERATLLISMKWEKFLLCHIYNAPLHVYSIIHCSHFHPIINMSIFLTFILMPKIFSSIKLDVSHYTFPLWIVCHRLKTIVHLQSTQKNVIFIIALYFFHNSFGSMQIIYTIKCW